MIKTKQMRLHKELEEIISKRRNYFNTSLTSESQNVAKILKKVSNELQFDLIKTPIIKEPQIKPKKKGFIFIK